MGCLPTDMSMPVHLQALVCAAQAEVRTALKVDVDEAIAEVTSAAEAFFEEAASAARSDILRSGLARRKELEEAADLKLSTMWKVATPCGAPPVPTGNCEPGTLTRGQFVRNDGSGVWHLARDSGDLFSGVEHLARMEARDQGGHPRQFACI